MKRGALLVVALLVAGGAAAQPADPLGLGIVAVEPDVGGDPVRGQSVAMGTVIDDLGRVACIVCHGLDGAGDPGGAFPRLAGLGEWYLYKALGDFAAGLRPDAVMMPVAQHLTDQDRRDVAAYYASLDGVPAFPPRSVSPETLQVGGALAAVGSTADRVPACAGCHGENGEGAAPIYPALAGQSATYIEHQLRLWQSGGRDGDPGDIMEMIARAMTDAEITAVAAYYAALPAVAVATAAPAP